MLKSKQQIWEKSNSGLKRIKTKRSDYKSQLIKYGILPSTYPYTKYHEEIMDKLKSNQFDDIRDIIKDKKTEIIIANRELRRNTPKNKVKSIIDVKTRNINNRLDKLKSSGLLPEDCSNLETEQQREIYNIAVNELDVYVKDIIHTYINDANLKTKQKYLYDKLKLKVRQPVYIKKGRVVNLKPEDIIVNEYCPFLGVKIDYRTSPRNTFVNNSHSFDRIVNSKSYVKGNVWIISRLANTMKNEATDDELKTFCKNVILMYARKTNTGI